MRQGEIAHGALVEGVALLSRHAPVPEGAGHLDLLADLLHWLLQERQRVLRDGLLLLGWRREALRLLDAGIYVSFLLLLLLGASG